MIALYLREQFPGEALMIAAIDEAIAQNREACRVQDMRDVCWLHREEIERQQAPIRATRVRNNVEYHVTGVAS